MHSEGGEDIWRPYHAKRPLVPSGARASPSPWHLPVFTWSRDFYPFDARGVDVKLLYILSRAEGYHILRKVMKSWSIVKHYILIYLDDLPICLYVLHGQSLTGPCRHCLDLHTTCKRHGHDMQMTCKTIAVTCCNRAPVYCEAPRSLELVQPGWAPSSDCLWILHCLHCLHCPHLPA